MHLGLKHEVKTCIIAKYLEFQRSYRASHVFD